MRVYGGVQECDAVFNLELPTDAATYAHRAGRTGRFGRPGLMVSVVEPQVDTRSESGQRVETRAGVASSSQRGPTRLHASTAAGYVLDNTQSGSHPSRS